MRETKNTMIGGVAILAVAGVLSKVIGIFFRIPLTNELQAEGIAIYQTAYPAYNMLLSISTAGIPVAISRMVAESVTLSKYRNAKAILRTALILLSIIGTVLMFGLIAFAGPLAKMVGAPDTMVGYQAIAPCILIVSIMAALRGYMQGRSNMKPTAISQLIEQLAKVLIALPIAMWGMRTRGPVFAAVGALLGITMAEFCALIYMVFTYRRYSLANRAELDQGDTDVTDSRTIAKRIIRIAIPITIGAMIVPLSGFIDSAMIRNRLFAAGIYGDFAEKLYGLLSGFVVSLINVPTMIATAICIGLVPTISAARIENRVEDMRENSVLGLRLGSLIGFPCSVGLSMLALPIIQLLYSRTPMEDAVIASRILTISAWTIILFTQVQASTGILQGAGFQKIPMYSLVAGVVVKVVMNYFLVAVPAINIYGAPFASIACYAISMVINIVYAIKKTGMRFDWMQIVVRPVIATAGMAAAIFLMMNVFDMTSRLFVLVTVFLAILVYAVLVFAIGALQREDLAQIPGGKKIEKLLIKLHIWRYKEV